MSETSAWSRTFQLVIVVVLIASVLSKSIFIRTPHSRVKKHTADQRLAEIQALLALAKNLPDVRETYGHGHANPFEAGRKKRSVDVLNGDVTTDQQQQQQHGNIKMINYEQALLDDVVFRRLWMHAATKR